VNVRFSISLRLTLWFGGIFFAGWVLFGISMWANLRHTLTGERRQTLARRIDRLEELLTQDKGSPADRAQSFAGFAHATGNGLAEVFRPDGSLEYPSPSPAATAFPWPRFDPANPNLFRTVQFGGQPYWVLARPAKLDGHALVLMAAAPEAGNLIVMQSFLRGLGAFVPVLLLISSAGGYWMSRRALSPVDRIASTARSITIRNISERVPVSGAGDEIQRLAETCNAMLERLEASVNQIKRFTADASHELRGPLSFARTVSEIALRNPHADPRSRQAFEDIVAEVAKAAVMLDEMLTLARADAAPTSLTAVPADLKTLLREVFDTARPIAEQNGLRLALALPPGPATVLGDAAALQRMVWIFLDNAIKYSKSEGAIALRLELLPGQVRIVVEDDGIGIAAADLPLIFDRFFRADPSRSLVEGNGLGLAIAKWIAEQHQAQLTAASDPGRGSSFRVTFPAHSSSAAAAPGERSRASSPASSFAVQPRG
jgi:signal transduction histidine kinase